MHRIQILVVVFSTTLLFVSQCEADEFRFTVVDSSSSSWVARGYSDYTVTPDDGWNFTASGNYGAALTFGLSGPAPSGTSVTNWGMTFDAPDSDPLLPGFYADFQRWPFNDPGRPGLSFSSTGRLDNQAAGFFELLEVTYAGGTTGAVTSFAANFTHFGETNPDRYAIVEFRYNASAIPEPSTFGLLLFLVSSTLCSRKKRN